MEGNDWKIINMKRSSEQKYKDGFNNNKKMSRSD